jgi:hypothetical protein
MVRRAAVAMLRLYPSHWRARYEDEVRALIEDRSTRRRDVLDLARGALDARFHPPVRSWVPAVAAIAAGGVWTVWSLLILTAPAPPDWPGYVQEMLLSALAVVAVLVLAVAGAWLRLGDDATRFERVSISLALAGHGAWFVMLLAAAMGIAYGAPTAVAASAAAVGTMFVGFALMTVDDTRVGALVAIAAVGLLVPYTFGWLVFGLGVGRGRSRHVRGPPTRASPAVVLGPS